MNPPECETVHAPAFVEVSVMVNRPRRLIDILHRKMSRRPSRCRRRRCRVIFFIARSVHSDAHHEGRGIDDRALVFIQVPLEISRRHRYFVFAIDFRRRHPRRRCERERANDKNFGRRAYGWKTCYNAKKKIPPHTLSFALMHSLRDRNV